MFQAKDVMSTFLFTVDPDDTIETAISLMLKHGLSGLPVLDMTGHLLGIISEFDLLDLVWDPQTNKDKVYHYMTREVHKVDENEDLSAVAELFRILSIRRLPVMQGDKLVGVISRRDLLRYVRKVREQGAAIVPPVSMPLKMPLGGPASV